MAKPVLGVAAEERARIARLAAGPRDDDESDSEPEAAVAASAGPPPRPVLLGGYNDGPLQLGTGTMERRLREQVDRAKSLRNEIVGLREAAEDAQRSVDSRVARFERTVRAVDEELRRTQLAAAADSLGGGVASGGVSTGLATALALLRTQTPQEALMHARQEAADIFAARHARSAAQSQAIEATLLSLRE